MVRVLPTLRTGLVIAAGYADKVRRVLFAQLRNDVKEGKLTNQDVAMAAGSLNRILFELLVNRLRVDKLDVVRIQVDYEVADSKVVFDFSTLSIELWRRVPSEDVEQVVKEFSEEAEKLLEEEIMFSVEKVGETDVGDVVYKVLYRGSEVGALLVTPVDGKVVIRGAVVEPTPLVVKRTTIDVSGDLDEYISSNVSQIFRQAQNVEKREASRVANEIISLVKGVEVEAGAQIEES